MNLTLPSAAGGQIFICETLIGL